MVFDCFEVMLRSKFKIVDFVILATKTAAPKGMTNRATAAGFKDSNLDRNYISLVEPLVGASPVWKNAQIDALEYKQI